MECFDAAFTMDSVVARRGGKFLIKAIFYPEYLNKIAVELAQHLRQIVFRRRDQLRALFDQLSSFFLQRGYLLLLIFDPLDDQLLSGTSRFPRGTGEHSVFGLQFFDERTYL